MDRFHIEPLSMANINQLPGDYVAIVVQPENYTVAHVIEQFASEFARVLNEHAAKVQEAQNG